MTLANVFNIATAVVAGASAAANILPPASTYDDYPRFKKFYETFIVNTVAAVSLSIRAQYPSLAVPMFGLKQAQKVPQITNEAMPVPKEK
jgi:hypothetical protein